MEIISVSLHDLRKMNNSEALILQGCGGDLKEWVDGINDMLTEIGILQNESRFEKAYSFHNEDLTCLLFPFDDVQLMTFSLMSVNLRCGDCRLTSSSAVHGFPIMFQTDLAVLFQKMNKNRMKIAVLRKKPKI